MTPLESICEAVLAGVEGARAIAVLDCNTGELLASAGPGAASLKSVLSGPPPGRQFLRPNVLAPFESLSGPGPVSKADLGASRGGRVHEVHISSPTSEHLFHLLQKTSAVAVLTTDKTANLAMSWAQLKSLVPKIEALLGRPQ